MCVCVCVCGGGGDGGEGHTQHVPASRLVISSLNTFVCLSSLLKSLRLQVFLRFDLWAFVIKLLRCIVVI